MVKISTSREHQSMESSRVIDRNGKVSVANYIEVGRGWITKENRT
jgi:hypothetical protein